MHLMDQNTTSNTTPTTTTTPPTSTTPPPPTTLTMSTPNTKNEESDLSTPGSRVSYFTSYMRDHHKSGILMASDFKPFGDNNRKNSSNQLVNGNNSNSNTNRNSNNNDDDYSFFTSSEKSNIFEVLDIDD